MKQVKKIIAVAIVFVMLFSVLPNNIAYAATKTKISKCKITLSKTSYDYTGSAIKPKVTVKYKNKSLKNNKDYKITYKNNTLPGTATVVVTGKGKYTGSAKKSFKIKNALNLKLSKKSFTYTGKDIKPTFTVKSGTKKLSSKDYTVSYKNNKNVGTAQVIVKGKGKYKNKKACQTFKINPASIEKAIVTLEKMEYIYTGKKIEPLPTVKLNNVLLKKDVDYTIEYKNNINVGQATVVINGIGNYTDSAKTQFVIKKEKKPEDPTTEQPTTEEPIDDEQKGITPETLTLQTVEDKEKGYINKAYVTVYWPKNEEVYCVTSVKNPTNKDNPRLNQYVSVEGNSEKGIQINGSRKIEIHANDATGDTEVYFKIKDKTFTCKVHVDKIGGGDQPENPVDPDEPKYKDIIENRDYRVGEYTYSLDDQEFAQIEGNAEWTISDETVAKIYDSATPGKKFINFIGEGKLTITATKGAEIRRTTVTVYPPQDDITCETTNSVYESNLGNGSKFAYGQEAASVISQVGLEKALPNELNNPNGFDYCKIGDTYYCFIADCYNNRVLAYTSKISVIDALSGGQLKADTSTDDPDDKASELAMPTYVLGQKDFTSSIPGYGLDQMNWPMSVAVEKWSDDKCRLYVTDVENNRVLVYEDIASLTNGAPADYVIDTFVTKEGEEHKIDWPWAIKSLDIDGVQKLVITSTAGYRLGIYNSPINSTWSDDVKTDLIYEFTEWTTPRTLCWTGSQLLVGDENIPWKGGSHSGFHVFDGFPASKEDTCFSFFGEVGYSEGAVINDKLYMLYAGGWNIFDKNEDGRFIEDENAVPDLELRSMREANCRVNPETEGYFIDAGGTNTVTYIKEDDTVVMPMLGRSAIYAWTNPTKQLASLNTSAPDVYIGNLKYKEDLRHTASDVQLHNPNVVSDGEHLVVHNDLDGLLHVYKNIPTSDGAIADYKYILYNAAMDVELTTKDNESTMIVTGNGNNTLYIWDDYKFDGALPNRVLRNRIGGLNLPEIGATLQYMRYDGEYSYLSITENGIMNVYIYEGLVDEDSKYIAKIEGFGNYSFGHVSANSEHIAITIDSFESGKGGLLVIDKSKTIKNATSENPLCINANDDIAGLYQITKVHCGVTATMENDAEDNGVESELCHYKDNKSEVQACVNNGLLVKTWTDKNGVEHTSHEHSYFYGVFGCLLTENGKLILTDLGTCRTVIWDSVEAAIADQSKDYMNLTEDNPHVVILGHGISAYDNEDLNGHTKYDGHYYKDVASADALRMPKTLAYDGHNLWVGEFKFSNRLLRFEMK